MVCAPAAALAPMDFRPPPWPGVAVDQACDSATRSHAQCRRYDVELYQKIEALIDMKLDAYPAEQEAVLVLLERVGEAQRIATMQMKETDSRKRGRKSAVDDDERDVEGGGYGAGAKPRKR